MIRNCKRNSTTSKKCLRSCGKENNNNIEKIKQKTYGKINEDNYSVENNSKELTLENSRWKDSFDRLLENGSPFGINNKIEKVIRASYNQNSSIDSPISKKNIATDLNEGNKSQNSGRRNEKRSPFNLDKSLGVINNKVKKNLLKKPKPKRKIQNHLKRKNTQQDTLKKKSTIASTPLRENKLQGYLQTCEISPIRPEIRQLFDLNAKNQEKLNLNYTDSIEEARNISLLKSNNTNNSRSCNCNNESLIIGNNFHEIEEQNDEEVIEDEHCDILENNQAGLNNSKMKYILNYLNKLPSYYEKYCLSDVTNLLDKSFESNKKNKKNLEDGENNIIQSLQSVAHTSFHVISLNSTISNSVNNVSQNFTSSLVNLSKNAPEESIINKNKKVLDDIEMSVHVIDLIEELNTSIVSDNINTNRNEIDNNTKKNCEQNSLNNSNKLINSSIQMIENNTNSVIFQDNCRTNSDYLITSNKLCNEISLLKIFNESEKNFAHKLIFLQNCHLLKSNIRNSKSLNCMQQNKTENNFRRHTIELDKMDRQKNKKNLKMLKIMSIKSNLKSGHSSISYNSILDNNLNLLSNRGIQEALSSEVVTQNGGGQETEVNSFAKSTLDNQSSSAQYSCETLNSVDNKSLSYFENNKRSTHGNIIDNVDKPNTLDHNCRELSSDNSYNIERLSEKHITRRRPTKLNNNKFSGRNNINRNSIVDNFVHNENMDLENPTQNHLYNKNVSNKLISPDTATLKSKIANKTENQIENFINNEISSEIQLESFEKPCEIVQDTPSPTRSKKNKRRIPTSTKIVANCGNENNSFNLIGNSIGMRLRRKEPSETRKRSVKCLLDDNNIPNKLKKSKDERQQFKVNLETKLTTNNDHSSKNRSLDGESDFIRILRTRKLLSQSKIIEKKIEAKESEICYRTRKKLIKNNNKIPRENLTKRLYSTSNMIENITSENEEININCLGKYLVNDNTISRQSKIISSEEKELSAPNKLKKCKIVLKREHTKNITYKKKNDKNFKFKNCKIVLKKMKLVSRSAILNHSKKNIYGLSEPNNLTNNCDSLSETNTIGLCGNDKLITCNLRLNNVAHISRSSLSKSSSVEPNSGLNSSSVTCTKTNSTASDCSVIEISFDKNEIIKKDSNFDKTSMQQKTRKRNNYNSIIQNRIKITYEESLYEDKEISNFTEKLSERLLNTSKKLSLPAGKWRRSLINWKKNQTIIELDESQIPVVLDKDTIFNLDKTITENKYKLMPKLSSCYKQNTILSEQLVDKELKTQILPVQKIIRNNDRKTCLDSSLVIISEKPEAECKVIEKRQTGVRKTLLLEPTDDGTPNYTTCSLFNTFAKPKAAETVFVSNRQKSKNSKRFIEIEEEDFNDLQQKDDQQQHQKQYQHHREEYSDERRCNSTITNNNHKQKYHHQLSVPICGTKQQQQSSIVSTIQRSTRRGRTSIIETANHSRFEQLSSSSSSAFTGSGDYHHHNSNREFIHSLLLNEDEQNILLCPSLNVSIRALLSPRDIVLRRCGQTDPYDFSIIYSEIELRQCRKIGEGVYGEVYMNKNRNGEAVVLKIIPIDGQIEINGEQQKNFEQILPEIIIAGELSRLRNDTNFMTSGFVDVKNVHCVQGRYPQHLIDLWELYRDNCGTENDHPEIFQDDQLYIVLELANGGQDLEAFQFQNALQSYSAFLQTALSLAVAERKFKFEHRDLHWGNILLAPTDDKEINFKFNEKIISIPTHGVKVTIIDYTLSRMNFEGCCLYNDLSNDHELFSASGDYQFDIYRLMQKSIDNQWERYDPYTNILWLHYTIDKMISGARYRSSKTRKHRSAIQDMMELRDELLDYKSASDYVECLD